MMMVMSQEAQRRKSQNLKISIAFCLIESLWVFGTDSHIGDHKLSISHCGRDIILVASRAQLHFVPSRSERRPSRLLQSNTTTFHIDAVFRD